MASKLDIINYGLVLLGEKRITSVDDTSAKAARESKAVWDITRDALLASYNWSFAMARTSLSADVSAPDHGYAAQYEVPPDMLRLVYMSDLYVGLDLTDYRTGPNSEFQIEGRKILTDWAAPLRIRYVKQAVDTAIYPAPFVSCLGARLAVVLCETLTQSSTKKADAERELQRAVALAVRANAIELPPEKLADDEWIMSRR